MKVYNPYTHKVITEVPIYGSRKLAGIMRRARTGAQTMANLSFHERSTILAQASAKVLAEKKKLAHTITAESGKPITQARKEVERCAFTLKLAAQAVSEEIGEMLPFAAYPAGYDRHGYYERVPLGIIFSMTPFNDPLNLVAHKLAPAIAGGNAVILKPSQETPLSALALHEILLASGLPTDAIQVIHSTRTLTKEILMQEDVRMFSFTGGENAGKTLAGYAGLKKLSMELGGNAPVIVMPDANISEAVTACVNGAYSANGQNCISVQRVLLHNDIAEEFIDLALKQVDKCRVGDPSSEDTDIGPLINIKAAQRYKEYYQNSLQDGLVPLYAPRFNKNLVGPAILYNKATKKTSHLDKEEAFSPVMEVSVFNEPEQALTKANRPRGMIAAGIFGQSINNILHMARKLEVASVMINDSSDYRMDGMPFGGYKYGSVGREGIKFALREMTQTKTICYKLNV